MRIPIDPASSEPLYRQVSGYLRAAILSGNLPAGTRLPATRSLAEELNVNRITIESAYASLQDEGLVAPRPGSGTYVLEQPARAGGPAELLPENLPLWQQELGAFQPALPLPEDLLAASGHAHPIHLANGGGDPRLFPVEDFRRVLHETLRRDGTAALGYGESAGFAPLRRAIARILTGQGVRAREESVLITAGSQQALTLAAQTLLRPGDTALVESPTYSGALDLFRSLGIKLVGVPMDEHGMQVEKLEALLQQHHPRLLYTMPNFQNPSGACMSAPRRIQLLALAERYNIPILEDDYVGDLRYEGRAMPALKALDPGGRVIYVSTFSKMLMPGLRVGFLVAEGPLYGRLLAARRATDLASSNLIQHALEDFMTIGRYQAHLRRACRLYRKRRDAMIQAARRYLPDGTHFSVPSGGLFLWIQLPGGVSAERLLPAACAEGISFLPGGRCFAQAGEGDGLIRLNFAASTAEEAEEGLRRLGKALRQHTKDD